MSTPHAPRRGWRHFKCDECGVAWRAPSRDCFSPSGDGCVRCSEWVHPFDCQVDLGLEVDSSGNLINPPDYQMINWP